MHGEVLFAHAWIGVRALRERADDVHEVAIGPVVLFQQGPQVNDAGVEFAVGPEALFLRGHGLADDEPFG